MLRTRLIVPVALLILVGGAHAQSPVTAAAQDALQNCALDNVADAVTQYQDIAQAANHAVNACDNEREALRGALFEHYAPDYPESAGRLADYLVSKAVSEIAPSVLLAAATAMTDG